MINNFQDPFRFLDAKISEDRSDIGNKNQSLIPTLEQLKSKLEDIFFAEKNDRDCDCMEDDFQTVMLEDGTVVKIPDENVRRIDDNDMVYLKDGELESETTYRLNGNIYMTDNQGRIIYCEAKPERTPENPRDINAQLQVGGEDRKHKDQGGHIVGRDLNGDGGAGNLVAMDSRINQSDYKRMENDIKTALDDGKNVVVMINISYEGDSKRPDIIVATVFIDGEKKTIYKFDNNIDGGLMNEVPEYGKETVQEEIDDVNGEISSIKEEYDERGNLSGTIVNITYTDEDGVNHRTRVYIDGE